MRRSITSSFALAGLLLALARLFAYLIRRSALVAVATTSLLLALGLHLIKLAEPSTTSASPAFTATRVVEAGLRHGWGVRGGSKHAADFHVAAVPACVGVASCIAAAHPALNGTAAVRLQSPPPAPKAVLKPTAHVQGLVPVYYVRSEEPSPPQAALLEQFKRSVRHTRVALVERAVALQGGGGGFQSAAWKAAILERLRWWVAAAEGEGLPPAAAAQRNAAMGKGLATRGGGRGWSAAVGTDIDVQFFPGWVEPIVGCLEQADICFMKGGKWERRVEQRAALLVTRPLPPSGAA